MGIGISVTEIEETFAARELDEWAEFWDREPWGAWRDNLHAAVIAREVQRPYMKKGATLSIDPFLVIHPDDREARKQEREARNKAGFISMLKAIATRRKRDG